MLANQIRSPVMAEFPKQFGGRLLSEMHSIIPDPLSASQFLNESLAAARAPSGHTLDILSAETYPSAPMPDVVSQQSKRRASKQLYGGLALEESSSNSSNEAILDQVRPKKRSKRASKSEEEDNAKRQRGRPRLETQDETPADRRRTQIRLAQRAYRHRKEITISALKKKVELLQSTIDAMNKSYIDLHDNLIDAGLLESRPALGQQLRKTLDEFTGFANQAADSDNEDDENEKDPSNAIDEEPEHRAAVKPGRQVSNKARPQDTNNAPLGYELSYRESPEMDVEIQDLPMFDSQNGMMELQNGTTDLSSLKDWNAMQNFQQYHVQIPEHHFNETSFHASYSTIEKPLKASQPYTYSFQETTFSRRLHRLCIERAFRGLNNTNSDRVFLNRAFRFTFCFSNRKKLLVRFQELLKRRAGESLENWNVPFFNIGGAGTHFPRRDEAGRAIYPPNMHSPSSLLRPHRKSWLDPETPRTEQNPEDMLEAMGYGGEWFDSHDVEEYLKLRGVHLDGSSSFIEVDPSTISLPALTSTASSPGTLPGLSPIPRTPPTPLHLEGFLDQEVQDTFGGPFDYDFDFNFDFSGQSQQVNKSVDFGGAAALSMSRPADTGFTAAMAGDQYAPTLQDVVGHRTGSVTVDVSKFLERMVDGAACLGRAPGFRKSHVDNALALSLQEAF